MRFKLMCLTLSRRLDLDLLPRPLAGEGWGEGLWLLPFKPIALTRSNIGCVIAPMHLRGSVVSGGSVAGPQA